MVRSPLANVADVVLPAVSDSGPDFVTKAADGEILVVYLGYTSCPDVCPTTMADLKRAVIDWIARYMEQVEDLPMTAAVEPGEIAARIPNHAPETSDGFAAMLADLDAVVMPGITNWQSPNWFAYFPANASGPSILAELVAAGLGQQGMLWSTCPATTEIETKVLDWLVDLMGVPQAWKSTGPGGGVIQMSASDATHAALVVARHRRRDDAPAEQMVVYVSNQAHSSIEKGCTVAGIGHCRKIDVDDVFALDPEALRAAIAEDRAAGLLPIAVVSAVGTTATTAIDPITAVSDIADEHGMWHHVDAAYAGTAMICEEFREYQPGLDRVDSYTFNPHKWMMVNFDCNILWVDYREALIDTMSILPPYLRNAALDTGEGRRLQGLARATRKTLPFTEAVVGASVLRSGWSQGHGEGSRRPCGSVR